MYTCHLIKLYYKLYRNKLPAYFEKFIPEYEESQHDLRHNNIRLPAIRCEYEKMNAKFQMHYRLREFENPSRPRLYPTVHIDMDTLSQSLTRVSKYIKSQFISSYSFHCISATLVKIVDKDAVSNMSYYGAFHHMFVYFHFCIILYYT